MTRAYTRGRSSLVRGSSTSARRPIFERCGSSPPRGSRSFGAFPHESEDAQRWCQYERIDIQPPSRYDSAVGKTDQLQIRVTASEKATLRRLARQAGQDVSSYVRSRALPAHRLRFQELMETLADEGERRFALAELNDLLTSLTRAELSDAVLDPPARALSPYWRNYVAAMVEQAAHGKNVPPPRWLADIEPLTEGEDHCQDHPKGKSSIGDGQQWTNRGGQVPQAHLHRGAESQQACRE